MGEGSDLVVENDRVILLGRHELLDRRPHALMFGRGDPLLTEFFTFELQFEAVIVGGWHRTLNDGAAFEHLHTNVALVLDSFRHDIYSC